jgi:signal transduction histidine kinase
MDEVHRWLLLTARLRTEVLARCERAFVHDARNSLQAVTGGIEAMARALLSGSRRVPPERIVELTRLAMTNHERALEEMILALANAPAPPASIDLDELVQSFTNFLTHDARHRDVDFDLCLLGPGAVVQELGSVRLVLLALLTDSIDSSPPRTRIKVATGVDGARAVISVEDSRETEPDAPSGIDSITEPSRHNLTIPVGRRLIEDMGGVFEVRDVQPAGRVVRLLLPRGEPSGQRDLSGTPAIPQPINE